MDARDLLDRTPLHLAAQGGRSDVCHQLLSAGAQVGATDCAGWTPLHCAAWFDRVACVEQLLAAGADLGARTGSGWGCQTAADLAGTQVGTLLRDAAAAQARWDGFRRLALVTWCCRPEALVAEVAQNVGTGSKWIAQGCAGRACL